MAARKSLPAWAALRAIALLFAKANLIGLSSDKYVGRHKSRAPAASIDSRTLVTLWVLWLSAGSPSARNDAPISTSFRPLSPRPHLPNSGRTALSPARRQS